MKPEVKEKWTAALLDGEYQQGDGYLRCGDSYCCLGVLCDLYIKEHPEEIWLCMDDEVESFRLDNEDGSLPVAVQQWAGLSEADPSVHLSWGEGEYVARSLAHLNDNGWSFEDIAKIIKEQL